MEMDLLDLYRRASEWTLQKVAGAGDQLDGPTPCEQWDVRTLMNHMLDTQRYFVGTARGEEGVSLPAPDPPELLGGTEPVAAFQRARTETLDAYGQPGAIERTGPALGIAFADQLLHGWDLAKATGQDATMPAGLAEAAYGMISGRLTDEQRQGAFKAAVPVAADAPVQDRLLAYTGRDPAA